MKKGEKASMIVFWKWLERAKQDEHGNVVRGADGMPEKENIPFLRHFNVFHIDQCEGILPRFEEEALPGEQLTPDVVADQIVQDYITRSGVKLYIERSDRAFYSPTMDRVTVPELSQFSDVAEYYSTLFHELTHSTGHAKRLNRLEKDAAFGSESYSKEELVAELGSAFLVNHAGLETASSFRNSVGYLQAWVKALREDKRLIVSAAGKADKAVELILGTHRDNIG